MYAPRAHEPRALVEGVQCGRERDGSLPLSRSSAMLPDPGEQATEYNKWVRKK